MCGSTVLLKSTYAFLSLCSMLNLTSHHCYAREKFRAVNFPELSLFRGQSCSGQPRNTLARTLL